MQYLSPCRSVSSVWLKRVLKIGLSRFLYRFFPNSTYQNIKRGGSRRKHLTQAKYLFEIGVWSPGKDRMCSYKILRKLSWKIWSVLMLFFSSCVRFASSRKFVCSCTILVLPENLMCSNKKKICVLLENSCFLITFKPPGKSDVL